MSTNQNQNTWKSWVDWWPAYIIIGISLAHFVKQTGIVQQLSNKFFTNKGKENEH